MRGAAACMHDALGYALVVEVRDLLAEDEVLQQRRSAGCGPQRVLVVGQGNALRRGHGRVVAASLLLQLPASASHRVGRIAGGGRG